MSGYKIFFDESNKIDDKNKMYSFYGAMMTSLSVMSQIQEQTNTILDGFHSSSELHFSEYTNDHHLKKYYRILDTAINSDIRINVIAVSNSHAQKSASSYDISLEELKNMFYIKIPERLFYGLTRYIPGQAVQNTEIHIDEAEDYKKILQDEKVREQLNAQSVYRDLKYYITTVYSEDSKRNLLLQITDCLLGFVSFIMEGIYQFDSKSAIIKNELIYSLFMTEDNLLQFQDKVKIFIWNKSSELTEVTFSHYIAPFLTFKSHFDKKELLRLSKLLHEHPNESFKFFRKEMGYSAIQNNMLRGFLAEIDGKSRLDLI